VSQTFDLREFLARSTDAEFDELTLGAVLDGLPSLSDKGPWLAGGALRRTLLGMEPESDFDFFFANADQLTAFTTELEKNGFVKAKETEHHLHYKGQIGGRGVERDIQCIRFKFYDSAASVIESFDFTVCMFAYDGKTLTCGETALWDLGRKRLAVHKISYPVASVRRLLKYTKQDFRACKGCLATLLRQTASSDELRAQLDIEYVD